MTIVTSTYGSFSRDPALFSLSLTFLPKLYRGGPLTARVQMGKQSKRSDPPKVTLVVNGSLRTNCLAAGVGG